MEMQLEHNLDSRRFSNAVSERLTMAWNGYGGHLLHYAGPPPTTMHYEKGGFCRRKHHWAFKYQASLPVVLFPYSVIFFLMNPCSAL